MAKKAGRPDKYGTLVEPRLDEVMAWARNGATNDEIAGGLGIARSTMQRYLNEYQDFSDAIREGKREGIMLVKAALLRRATGYDYEEKELVTTLGPDGKADLSKPPKLKTYKRHVPADLNAVAMYLRNSSEEWSDMDSTTRMVKEAEAELKKAMATMQGFRCIPAWGISTALPSGRDAGASRSRTASRGKGS